jgi:hypothetical protein
MAYLLYVTVGLPVRYNWSPTEYEIAQFHFCTIANWLSLHTKIRHGKFYIGLFDWDSIPAIDSYVIRKLRMERNSMARRFGQKYSRIRIHVENRPKVFENQNSCRESVKSEVLQPFEIFQLFEDKTRIP